MTNLHYHGIAIPPVQPADDVYMLSSAAPYQDRQAYRSRQGNGHQEHKQFRVSLARPRRPSLRRLLVSSPPAQRDGRPGSRRTVGASDHRGLHREPLPEACLSPSGAHLLFKDIALPAPPTTRRKPRPINGVLGGTLHLPSQAVSRSGRLGNIGADSYFDLALDGHKLWVLARDGNALSLSRAEEPTIVFLPPFSAGRRSSSRSLPVGRYALRTREGRDRQRRRPQSRCRARHAQGLDGRARRQPSEVSVAQLDARRLTIEKARADSRPRSRHCPVTRQRRTLSIPRTPQGLKFYLDGKPFAMDRIDVEVKLGDVEEWTLVNDTDERHTFHIHQLEFLVQSVGGNPLETVGRARQRRYSLPRSEDEEARRSEGQDPLHQSGDRRKISVTTATSSSMRTGE